MVPPLVALALATVCCSKVQDRPEVHTERSRALASKGDRAGAIAELRKSAQLEPRSSEVHENLGFLLASGGDINSAIAEYREAITLKPDYAEAHYNLANELFSSGDAEGAKAQYRMVVTSSTPNGLGAFLPSELPFKAVPKEIPIHVSVPGQYPIVLTIFGSGAFKINFDDTSNEQLGPRLNDVFANRAERVIWVRSDHRLPFSELMRVTGILKSAGVETVNLILLQQ